MGSWSYGEDSDFVEHIVLSSRRKDRKRGRRDEGNGQTSNVLCVHDKNILLGLWLLCLHENLHVQVYRKLLWVVDILTKKCWNIWEFSK